MNGNSCSYLWPARDCNFCDSLDSKYAARTGVKYCNIFILTLSWPMPN